MTQHVTHTHKIYFFKEITDATLVKVMPPVYEGQIAEGEVIRQSFQAS